jgi:hypothetical protein
MQSGSASSRSARALRRSGWASFALILVGIVGLKFVEG